MASCLQTHDVYVSENEGDIPDLHIFIPTIESSAHPESCQYVVINGTEYSTLKQVQSSDLGAQPWNMSTEQGIQLSGAIALCWAVAYGFRMLIKSLETEKEES